MALSMKFWLPSFVLCNFALGLLWCLNKRHADQNALKCFWTVKRPGLLTLNTPSDPIGFHAYMSQNNKKAYLRINLLSSTWDNRGYQLLDRIHCGKLVSVALFPVSHTPSFHCLQATKAGSVRGWE